MEKESVEPTFSENKFNKGSEPFGHKVRKNRKLSPDQYADMIIKEVRWLEDYYERDKYE